MPDASFDLVVVGSGIAGLYAALQAHEHGASVLIVTKGAIDEASTRFAQGGIAVALGPGAQRRQIGPRARLGEPLAPHLLAPKDLRQVIGLLRVAAFFDQRRARVQRPREVHADVRRALACRLFVEDQLLGR